MTDLKEEFEQETRQGIGYKEGKEPAKNNGTYNDAYVEWLEAKINYTRCCDKLPNIESTEFRNWMTDNGYTDEQYGTMKKDDERYCINNLFKHYQNLLEFGNCTVFENKLIFFIIIR